jgi:hypothetical protein
MQDLPHPRAKLYVTLQRVLIQEGLLADLQPGSPEFVDAGTSPLVLQCLPVISASFPRSRCHPSRRRRVVRELCHRHTLRECQWGGDWPVVLGACLVIVCCLPIVILYYLKALWCFGDQS